MTADDSRDAGRVAHQDQIQAASRDTERHFYDAAETHGTDVTRLTTASPLGRAVVAWLRQPHPASCIHATQPTPVAGYLRLANVLCLQCADKYWTHPYLDAVQACDVCRRPGPLTTHVTTAGPYLLTAVACSQCAKPLNGEEEANAKEE